MIEGVHLQESEQYMKSFEEAIKKYSLVGDILI